MMNDIVEQLGTGKVLLLSVSTFPAFVRIIRIISGGSPSNGANPGSIRQAIPSRVILNDASEKLMLERGTLRGGFERDD